MKQLRFLTLPLSTKLMYAPEWKLKPIKSMFIKFLFLVISIFSIVTVYCQEASERFIDSMMYVNKLDSLNLIYGNNKKVPNDLKLCFLIAMSYYPEMANSKIRFKTAKVKTTLNTRPTALSILLNKKSNRNYIIRINNSTHPNKVLIHHTDFNSKIGLLGHEIAHIHDYSRINVLGVINRGIAYLGKKSKRNYENKIDRFTIERGLGWQLHDFSDFVLNKSNATEKYKKFKKYTYLKPEQIKEQIVIKSYDLGSDYAW